MVCTAKRRWRSVSEAEEVEGKRGAVCGNGEKAKNHNQSC